MKKQYVALKIRAVVFSQDIVTSSDGDYYEDDIWQ